MDILSNIFVLLLITLFVEAVTEIVVDSEIMFNFRNFLAKKSDFFGSLVTCGYCASVWVSAVAALIVPFAITGIWLFDYILLVFILHRSANIMHELFSRWFERHPFVFFVNMNKSNAVEEETLEDETE